MPQQRQRRQASTSKPHHGHTNNNVIELNLYYKLTIDYKNSR